MVLSLQVILTTCYTNALLLTDLYPYGTEHGDTMMTGSSLPIASLQLQKNVITDNQTT